MLGQWADGSCIPESGCCCLFVSLFLHFSFSPIFNIEIFHHSFLRNCEAIFLSLQFSTFKFFVTLFLGTMRPRRLKLGTHVNSGQMYHVIRLLLLSYLFISSFLFLSSFQHWNFSSHFSWELWSLKIETWDTHRQWADVSYILYSSGCCCFFHLIISSFFFPIFKC